MEDQQIDKAEYLIRRTCEKAMRSRKAKLSEKLTAAQLLAGVMGLYGPGRPKVLAPARARRMTNDEINKGSQVPPHQRITDVLSDGAVQ